MPRTKERTAQIFSAPPALGAKLCAQRDLSALFWRLLPQAFWFCHPAQKQQRRAFLQSLRGSMASAFAPPPPPPPADSADSAPVQDGKQKTLPFFATRISVLGQNYKKAAALRVACAPFCFAFKACVHNGVPRVLSQGPVAPVPKRARTTPPPPLPLPATTNSERSPTKPVTRPRPHVRTARVGPKGARSMYNVRSTVCASFSLSLSLSLAPHPKKISKHAPQKNQKAFAYGTEAGSGSHLANQEASGAGKAFAYGTGAGGRSHLAKLRDGARHCAELYAALRDGARHCNSALSLSFLLRILSGAAKAPWRPAPERIRSKNKGLEK